MAHSPLTPIMQVFFNDFYTFFIMFQPLHLINTKNTKNIWINSAKKNDACVEEGNMCDGCLVIQTDEGPET